MLKVVHDGSEPNATSESAASSSLLDEIVRDGARQMLAAALQAEVAAYIEAHARRGRRATAGGWWSATATTPSGR